MTISYEVSNSTDQDGRRSDEPSSLGGFGMAAREPSSANPTSSPPAWIADSYHGEHMSNGNVYFAVKREFTRVTTLTTDEAEFLELCAMFGISDTTLKPWTNDEP